MPALSLWLIEYTIAGFSFFYNGLCEPNKIDRVIVIEYIDYVNVLHRGKDTPDGGMNRQRRSITMRALRSLLVAGFLAGFVFPALAIKPAAAGAFAVDYDIVYVRQPRNGDNSNTTWPEIFHPARIDAGADLMLLHPDGSEELLVDCTICSVTDPFVSFDGQSVYYALFHDLTQLNSQRGDLPLLGADIFRIHVASGQIEQLTHGEFTPNTGAGIWDENNPPESAFQFQSPGLRNSEPGPDPGCGWQNCFHQQSQWIYPAQEFYQPHDAALCDG